MTVLWHCMSSRLEDEEDEEDEEDGEEVDLGDKTLSVFEQPAKDARPLDRDIDLKESDVMLKISKQFLKKNWSFI